MLLWTKCGEGLHFVKGKLKTTEGLVRAENKKAVLKTLLPAFLTCFFLFFFEIKVLKYSIF